MSEENNHSQEDNRKKKESTSNKLDTGLWIAIIAILISVATAFISLYEAKLMKSQQALMMEQRSAAAWPYIQIKTNSYVESNKVNLKLIIENKGVGPAILKDVQHYLKGTQVETYNFLSKLEELYPDFQYFLVRNQQIDNIVISAKEEIVFLEFNIEIDVSKNSEINELIQNLNKEIKFCYCSIYKECWQYDRNKKGEFDKCK